MLDAEALDRSWSHSAGLGGRDAEEIGAEDDWRRGQEASDVLSDTQEKKSSDNQEVRGARDSERVGTCLLTHSHHHPAKLTSARQRVKTALRSVDAAAIKWSGRGEFVGWGGLWGLGVGAGRDIELDSGVVLPFSARARRTTSSVTRSLQLVRPACSNSAYSLTCMRLQYTQSSPPVSVCMLLVCSCMWRPPSGILLPSARGRPWQAQGQVSCFAARPAKRSGPCRPRTETCKGCPRRDWLWAGGAATAAAGREQIWQCV
jgi:hypothetical protein